MFYFPGFMQDSRVLQLELKLSEPQITTLLEKYDDVPNRGGPGCFYLDEPHTCHSLNKSFEFKRWVASHKVIVILKRIMGFNGA
jgi:hypothetical protein